MKRRDFVKAGVVVGAAGLLTSCESAADQMTSEHIHMSRLKHSVCKWCYPDISVDDLAAAASGMGMHSVELLDPEDWDTVKHAGLTCAMANGPGPIPDGWNRIENHEWLVPQFRQRIDEVADAGLPNVICFSGNRGTISDEEGLENCAIGLEQILTVAESRNVTVCMELLNSRVDHADYQCDRTEWGVKLVDRLGSDRFKLLYDIYHMQIMEGDVIRTIRTYADYIGHYHTGGNPGRNEIDETQELNYAAISAAIVETGFTGYMAQEFIPRRDPLTSLREAVSLCTV